MNIFRMILNPIWLKLSETTHRLYPYKVKMNINWHLIFSSRITTMGTCLSELLPNRKESTCINNSDVIINLSKKLNEETIIHTMSHEALHIAINNCLFGSVTKFTEKVIDEWLLGSKVMSKAIDQDCRVINLK